MLAFYCQQCGALDDKGARAHRCASTRSVTPALAVVSLALRAATVAITNVEPAKLTPKQRSKANREAYNARQRTLIKERRVAATAKRD